MQKSLDPQHTLKILSLRRRGIERDIAGFEHAIKEWTHKLKALQKEAKVYEKQVEQEGKVS